MSAGGAMPLRSAPDEVSIGVSEGTSAEIIRRDRARRARERVAHPARRGLLLVDDRYSSHSTSDLRARGARSVPQAARRGHAVPGARPRPRPPVPRAVRPRRHRRRARHARPRLRLLDRRRPRRRRRRDRRGHPSPRGDHFVSGTAWASDGSGRSAVARAMASPTPPDGAWFSFGAEATLSEPGGRRPEGHAAYSARYRSDLPDPDAIAAEAFARAHEAVGAAPHRQRVGTRWCCLNRAVGRISRPYTVRSAATRSTTAAPASPISSGRPSPARCSRSSTTPPSPAASAARRGTTTC
jgi:hypothetical protein